METSLPVYNDLILQFPTVSASLRGSWATKHTFTLFSVLVKTTGSSQQNSLFDSDNYRIRYLILKVQQEKCFLAGFPRDSVSKCCLLCDTQESTNWQKFLVANQFTNKHVLKIFFLTGNRLLFVFFRCIQTISESFVWAELAQWAD